jgi:hypothetical protein
MNDLAPEGRTGITLTQDAFEQLQKAFQKENGKGKGLRIVFQGYG